MLVIYVCMHSSSKVCRLLTTSASRPQSVRMVSSPCAPSSVDLTAQNTINGRFLVSVALLWQFHVCTSSSACRVPASLVFYSARDFSLAMC